VVMGNNNVTRKYQRGVGGGGGRGLPRYNTNNELVKRDAILTTKASDEMLLPDPTM
jgi:hypothetical protein